MEKYSELWRRGPRLAQSDQAFRLGMDSVLLAAFTTIKNMGSCMDLGCGAGSLMVLLAARNGKVRLQGLEIQEQAAGLCRKNLRLNGLENRALVTHGDIRNSRQRFAAGSFDLVISNPPYFPENAGSVSESPVHAHSRSEVSCTLDELCGAAAYLCRFGGFFSMAHRPERLAEVICRMSGAGLEPKRLRLVHHRPGSSPSLALIEGRRGGKRGLTVEPPLFIKDSDGSDTEEIKQIYHLA